MSLDRQRIDGVKTLLSEGWKWSLQEGWINPKAPKTETSVQAVAATSQALRHVRDQPGSPHNVFKEYDTGTKCTYWTTRSTTHGNAPTHWVMDDFQFCIRCGQRILP